MAFVRQEGDEEEVVGGAAPQSAMIQPAGAVGTPTKPTATGGSGLFQNIQQYIEANRPQAQQMAGKVAQQYGQQAQTLQQKATAKKSAFEEGQIAQQKQAIQEAEKATQTAIEKAGTEGFTAPEMQYGQYLPTQQAGTYYGQVQAPQYIQELAQARKLQQQTQQAPSMAAIEQSLTPVGGLGYTGGERSLDALLIGRTPEVTQRYLEDVRAAGEGVPEAVRAQQVASQAMITGEAPTSLQALEASARERALAGITGAETDITRALGEREVAEEARRQALASQVSGLAPGEVGVSDEMIIQALKDIGQYREDTPWRAPVVRGYEPYEQSEQAYSDMLRNLQSQFKTGTLGVDPELATKLGLPTQLETYGLRPEDYLKVATDVTPEMMATERDYQRARALAEIAGRPTESVLQPQLWGEPTTELRGVQEYLDAIEAAKTGISIEELMQRAAQYRSAPGTYSGPARGGR
jgi:hypothetical protein